MTEFLWGLVGSLLTLLGIAVAIAARRMNGGARKHTSGEMDIAFWQAHFTRLESGLEQVEARLARIEGLLDQRQRGRS